MKGRGVKSPLHDFKNCEELRMTMAGWFHKDQAPRYDAPTIY